MLDQQTFAWNEIDEDLKARAFEAADEALNLTGLITDRNYRSYYLGIFGPSFARFAAAEILRAHQTALLSQPEPATTKDDEAKGE